MDETYRAKLSGTPPGEINTHGHAHDAPAASTAAPAAAPQPIPVQLPNIYVNTYPPPPAAGHGTQHRTHHQPPFSPPPRMMHLGPFRFARPHPLLWISLALSLIALVLEVPKGSLPTLTGRHKALRSQEKLVQERLTLLTRLSTFLPPPLASMIDPQPHAQSHHSLLGSPSSPDILRFWNTHAHDFVGQGGDRWWSVEDLGEGASVVRSRSGSGAGGGEREVWVLRVGTDEGNDNNPLLNALTHSLLLRDRLLSELAQLQASQTSSTALSTSTAPGAVQQYAPAPSSHHHHHEDEQHQQQERERERRKREREREREVEEREREVGRREKWVIEEMRQLSDKVHAEASELTLEDRITERLKAYQRQLGRLADERDRKGDKEL